MATVSVTYTFQNGTVADAPQVNQNFSDLVNALTDGSKDLNVNNITTQGNLTVEGTLSYSSIGGTQYVVAGSQDTEVWDTDDCAVQIGGNAYIGANDSTQAGNAMHIVQNAYYANAGQEWTFISSDGASMITFENGLTRFYNTAPGVADTAVTWVNTMNIGATGIHGLVDSTFEGLSANPDIEDLSGCVDKRILFGSTGGQADQDVSLQWDYEDKRLIVGSFGITGSTYTDVIAPYVSNDLAVELLNSSGANFYVNSPTHNRFKVNADGYNFGGLRTTIGDVDKTSDAKLLITKTSSATIYGIGIETSGTRSPRMLYFKNEDAGATGTIMYQCQDNSDFDIVKGNDITRRVSGEGNVTYYLPGQSDTEYFRIRIDSPGTDLFKVYKTGDTEISGDLTVSNADIDSVKSFVNFTSTNIMEIDQGGYSIRCLRIAGDSVDHGVTSILDTNQYYGVGMLDSDNGGAAIVGLSDNAEHGIALQGIKGSTGPYGAVLMESYVKDGSGTQAVADNECIVEYRNGGAIKAKMRGDGQMTLGSTLNKYAVYSDEGTGGSGSAGSGNQYVELEINGTTYKILHDGTV